MRVTWLTLKLMGLFALLLSAAGLLSVRGAPETAQDDLYIVYGEWTGGRARYNSAQIINMQGAERGRLLYYGRGIYNPGCSPDGTKMAFLFAEAIHILDVVSGEIQRIPNTDHEPQWGMSVANDGSFVIATVNGAIEDNGDIVRIDTATGDYTYLTDTPAIYEGAASVAPDGQSLVFSSNVNHLNARFYFRNSTFRINIDGTGLTELANYGGEPQFSPDGSMIAFSYPREGLTEAIMLHDLRARHTVQLIPPQSDSAAPAFSPDGRYIVYQHRVFQGQGNELFLFDVVTGQENRLTANSGGEWYPCFVVQRPDILLE
jgi:Tol biopolymer transport system component